MRKSNFIHESEVYRILSAHGIKVPKFETDLSNLTFQFGDPVVVKGIADQLWHKSDVGALHFMKFSKKEILELDKKMQKSLSGKYQWIETMVCSQSHFKVSSGLPSEGYISIQDDKTCGAVIQFGVGGIHAEAWAKELGSRVCMWSPELTTPLQALDEISKHWLGKVWLGELRQAKALTDSAKLLSFLNGIWEIALNLKKNNISLLEMNPVVIDEDGSPIALDGVGTYNIESSINYLTNNLLSDTLLNPKSIAIAGVSEKVGNFGRRILQNLINSSISLQNIKVIKPNTEEIAGVKCLPNIKSLVNEPVDILILTLPASLTVQTIIELCEQGCGAEVVYLVAGGIGDSGDKTGLSFELQNIIQTRRNNNLWTPTLIGPNSLGIIISPLSLSTLFISPEKLPLNFHAQGNIAFISQSGAFFITRFSKEENLAIKYGFCIGNQMDLKASELLEVIGSDPDIKVIAVYLEGFQTSEVLKFAKIAKKLVSNGLRIVLYKGGRSVEGMNAAAGHTGAMAGNYELQKQILKNSNIYITENFQEFTSSVKFLSIYPDYQKCSKIAVISNAGFETVAAADHIGHSIMPINDLLTEELKNVLENNGLGGLVGVSNPLDLTPMADELIYLECTEVFAKSSAEAILVCLVPLTDKLETNNLLKIKEFANKLKAISSQYRTPILIACDSGYSFDHYREAFSFAGLPTFLTIEDAFFALKYKHD